MNRHKLIVILYLFLTTLSSCGQRPDNSNKPVKSLNQPATMGNEKLALATLGGGCFWCVEAVYQELKGVYKVESGYAGGDAPNPTYKDICTGKTGHAEVIQIQYDTTEITFEEILEVFWSTHDPTTLNRQGNDIGTQYRSVIFYHDDTQRQLAEYSKKEIATQLWDGPIVTEITPIQVFYPAESYHQNYYRQNATAGYCSAIITPKLLKFRKRFADKLK